MLHCQHFLIKGSVVAFSYSTGQRAGFCYVELQHFVDNKVPQPTENNASFYTTILLMIDFRAGPDLLDPLDAQIHFFNRLRSGTKRFLRIFTTRILVTDLITLNLAFLLFIRYVKWQKTCNQQHKKAKKILKFLGGK